MPQANAPSILNYVPLPKSKGKKPRPYDPSSDPRPQFDLSFPMDRMGGAGSTGGSVSTAGAEPSDRDRADPEVHTAVRHTKKTSSPTRNRNAAGGSPVRARELEPLMRSSVEGDIYRDISFPTNRYQQDNYSTSAIVEAGSTQRFGQHINFTIRRIYNGCFSIDIGVRDTNQQWQVLIQKVEATDHVMRLWESCARMCQSDIGVLGTWLLACTKLDFDNNWVTGARFEYASLRELCAREIYGAVSLAAVTIQAHVRRHLVLTSLHRQQSELHQFPVQYNGNGSEASLHSVRSNASSEFSRSLTASMRINSQYHSPVPPSYKLSTTDPYSPSRGGYSDSDMGRNSGVRFMSDSADPYRYREQASLHSESERMVPRMPGQPKGPASAKRGRVMKPRTPSRSVSPRGAREPNSRQHSRSRDGDAPYSRGVSRSGSPRGRLPLASEKYTEDRANSRNKKMNPVKKPYKKRPVTMSSHVPVKPDMEILSLEMKQMRERMELLQDTLKLQNEYRDKLDAKANEEIRQARREADEAIKKAKSDALLEILNLFRGGADIDNIVRQLGVDRQNATSAQESRRMNPPKSKEGIRAVSASQVDRSIYSVNSAIIEEPQHGQEEAVSDDDSQNDHSSSNRIAAALPQRKPVPPAEGRRQKTKSFRVTKELPSPLKTGGASVVSRTAYESPGDPVGACPSTSSEVSALTTGSGILATGATQDPNYTADQIKRMQASDLVVQKLKEMGNNADDVGADSIFSALRVAVDMRHSGLLGLCMERFCRLYNFSPKIRDVQTLGREAELFMKACRDFTLDDTAFSSIIGCLSIVVDKLDASRMNGKSGAAPTPTSDIDAIPKLCSSGLIMYLLSALEIHHKSEKFSAQILGVMTSLAKVKADYERELSSRAGSGSVMTILEEHQGDHRVMDALARWVIQCCRDSVSAQDNLCQAGVTATLPAVMIKLLTSGPLNKYNEMVSSTIALLCKAGSALCGEKNRESLSNFCSTDNCKTLVEVLAQLNAYNSPACENLIWLLMNTVSSIPETRGNMYRSNFPSTMCEVLGNLSHAPTVSQFGVYLISSLATDQVMKAELGHQGLINELLKISTDNNLADTRRTARVCIQKISDSTEVGGSSGGEIPTLAIQTTQSQSDNRSDGVPVVESPLNYNQVEQDYWHSARQFPAEKPDASGSGGASASIDVPLTNALNEKGSLGSPNTAKTSPDKNRDMDDSEDRWSSGVRRAKSRGQKRDDGSGREVGSSEAQKRLSSRGGSRGAELRGTRSPRDTSRSRGDSRGRSPSKRPGSKGVDARSKGSTDRPSRSRGASVKRTASGGAGGADSRQEPTSRSGKRSGSTDATRVPSRGGSGGDGRARATSHGGDTGRALSRGGSGGGDRARATSRGGDTGRAISRGADTGRASSRGAGGTSRDGDARVRTTSIGDTSVAASGEESVKSKPRRSSSRASRGSEDGSVRKKRKKKKDKSSRKLDVDDEESTPGQTHVPAPALDDAPGADSPDTAAGVPGRRPTQLSQIFGSGGGSSGGLGQSTKTASKPPKRAEGKPTTPRKDEEITNGAMEAPAPVMSAEEKADSKVKPAPEMTTTRREMLQKEFEAAKIVAKSWKRKLAEWGVVFEEKYNRPATMEDKKSDPYMQEIFQNYFTASNKCKQLTIQIGLL